MANQPLDPDSPEFRWISRTIRTVEKRLGRQAGWNGAIEQDLAWSDRDRMEAGTLVVRDDTVLDPLRRVMQPQGRSTEQLDAAARAISIVARETAIAIAEPSQAQEDQDMALLVGAAEMFSHEVRDDLVSDIGLPEAVPELANHTTDRYIFFFHATGAAQGLLRGLEERTKQSYADSASRILTTPAADRWQAIADIAVDLRVTGDQREAACIALATEGRTRFAAVMQVITAPTTPQQKVDDGIVLGDGIAEHLVQRMDAIPPTAPGYRWAARVIQAVEDRTGLATRWNGRIYPAIGPKLAGAVYPDHTMTLSETYVFAPIERAYTKQGPLTEAEAIEAVDATYFVVHEAGHASGPHPEIVDGDMRPVDRALEEGLTEVWTYRNRSSIIHDVGLDQAVPEVAPHAARDMLSYAGYGNAAFGMVDDLAVLSGRSADEVTLMLLAADPNERWGMIADLALDKQLPDLPAEQRSELRAGLVAGLQKDYQAVVDLQAEADDPTRSLQEIQNDSHAAGRSAVAHLANRIGAVVTEKDPGVEVSPEIQQLRSVAFVGNVRAAPGTPSRSNSGSADGAAARRAPGPVTARSSRGDGRGSSLSPG